MKKNIFLGFILNLLFAQLLHAQLFGGQIKTPPQNPCPTTVVLEVISPITGRIWMDRNLGAAQVATSMDDQLAYGDLYQWGRSCDGHQKRYSGLTVTDGTVNTNNPGKRFVRRSTISDWRSPKNDDLWQGVDGINNPCPPNFYIPTKEEWAAENIWTSQQEAYEGFLKLTLAGYRSEKGNLTYVMTDPRWLGRGYYHTSTTESDKIRFYNINTNANIQNINLSHRVYAYSVRCIKKM